LVSPFTTGALGVTHVFHIHFLHIFVLFSILYLNLYIFAILVILFIDVSIDKLGIDNIRMNPTTVEGLLIEIGSLI